MDDAIAWLFSLERLGMKFGLEQIARLAAALGHPERAFQSIHIAGTNGKGSVTAMVDAVLGAAGHRSARYTSPHLVRLEERFVILGREVETPALASAAARVRDVTGRLVADGTLEALPTFFECTTAVAFELFRRSAVDLAVLEVGLGGRLDATNIVTPAVSAITSIDFDHQAQLGSSIADIAAEKAGIIKPGVPVVCGALPEAAAAIVRAVAARVGAPVIVASERVSVTPRPDAAVDIQTTDWTLPAVALGLEGAHQRQNAAVAVTVLEALTHAGVAVSADAVSAGLTTVRWPARIEHFDLNGIRVTLDAAHNPAGAAALASYLEDAGGRDLTLVFGAVRDKDVAGMLDALVGAATDRWGSIVCTTAPGERALAADQLAALALGASGGRVPVETVPDPAAALLRARQRGRPIVAAGSIFLIGPLRDILR